MLYISWFVLWWYWNLLYVSNPRNEHLNLLARIKFLNLSYIYLNKNWKIYWSPNTVLLVLCRGTGAHCEDCVSWSSLWYRSCFCYRYDFIFFKKVITSILCSNGEKKNIFTPGRHILTMKCNHLYINGVCGLVPLA